LILLRLQGDFEPQLLVVEPRNEWPLSIVQGCSRHVGAR